MTYVRIATLALAALCVVADGCARHRPSATTDHPTR